MTNRSSEFLLDLAKGLEHRLGGVASVQCRVDDNYCEVKVTPLREGPCEFIVHSEDDAEMTIELGQFTVGHVYSTQFGDLVANVNSVVEALLTGQVPEAVGFVKGKPCRAKARIGNGPEEITWWK